MHILVVAHEWSFFWVIVVGLSETVNQFVDAGLLEGIHRADEDSLCARHVCNFASLLDADGETASISYTTYDEVLQKETSTKGLLSSAMRRSAGECRETVRIQITWI
jgi:hypothetical protein